MDNLINTEKDVAYLLEQGILEHWLGSDIEVAEMFNGLCKELVFCHDNSYLCNLSRNVNKYFRLRWNRWIAGLNISISAIRRPLSEQLLLFSCSG
jgi:hypothetical protein